MAADEAVVRAPAEQLLESLAAASDKLKADFGSWKTPWGEINRFERLNGDIVQPFSDAGPSIPVGFTSSQWGSLASFGARAYPGTKKWYGTSGNSFVAVVEFGERVRAKAVTAGGESGNPTSPHFNDQAKRYSTGDLRSSASTTQETELAVQAFAPPIAVVQNAHLRAAIGITLRHSGHSFVVGSGGASPRRIRAISAFMGATTKK